MALVGSGSGVVRTVPRLRAERELELAELRRLEAEAASSREEYRNETGLMVSRMSICATCTFRIVRIRLSVAYTLGRSSRASSPAAGTRSRAGAA